MCQSTIDINMLYLIRYLCDFRLLTPWMCVCVCVSANACGFTPELITNGINLRHNKCLSLYEMEGMIDFKKEGFLVNFAYKLFRRWNAMKRHQSIKWNISRTDNIIHLFIERRYLQHKFVSRFMRPLIRRPIALWFSAIESL